MTNQRNRIAEVVDAVAQRLVLIGRHEAAAELLQGIDDVPAAVRWVLCGLADTPTLTDLRALMMCPQLSSGFHMTLPKFDGLEVVHDMHAPVGWVTCCCCLAAMCTGRLALSFNCYRGIVMCMYRLHAWETSRHSHLPQVPSAGSKAVAGIAMWL